MAEKRRRFLSWLVPRVLIFVVGLALGYYVRDRQHSNLQDAYREAQAEIVRLKGEVVERGRRAGEGLRGGAQAAADSTRAAVKEIIGDTTRKR